MEICSVRTGKEVSPTLLRYWAHQERDLILKMCYFFLKWWNRWMSLDEAVQHKKYLQQKKKKN